MERLRDCAALVWCLLGSFLYGWLAQRVIDSDLSSISKVFLALGLAALCLFLIVLGVVRLSKIRRP